MCRGEALHGGEAQWGDPAPRAPEVGAGRLLLWGVAGPPVPQSWRPGKLRALQELGTGDTARAAGVEGWVAPGVVGGDTME